MKGCEISIVTRVIKLHPIQKVEVINLHLALWKSLMKLTIGLILDVNKCTVYSVWMTEENIQVSSLEKSRITTGRIMKL